MYWNQYTTPFIIAKMRLTLTWDVLKCAVIGLILWNCVRLTLTWDVLKLQKILKHRWYALWLTLTWDVLKLTGKQQFNQLLKININMRCIEIQTNILSKMKWSRLTLTWDVLKCIKSMKKMHMNTD